MTAPDRIYRGVTVGGRVVYQDSPPSDDQLVWPWEAYIRTILLAEALAVPEQQAFMNALAFGNIHAEGGCQCDLCRASRDLVAALRAIGEGRADG